MNTVYICRELTYMHGQGCIFFNRLKKISRITRNPKNVKIKAQRIILQYSWLNFWSPQLNTTVKFSGVYILQQVWKNSPSFWKPSPNFTEILLLQRRKNKLGKINYICVLPHIRLCRLSYKTRQEFLKNVEGGEFEEYTPLALKHIASAVWLLGTTEYSEKLKLQKIDTFLTSFFFKI